MGMGRAIEINFKCIGLDLNGFTPAKVGAANCFANPSLSVRVSNEREVVALGRFPKNIRFYQELILYSVKSIFITTNWPLGPS